jgi:hypothetical protein
VSLAASLGARRCELFKDVDGYFSADPNTHADAARDSRADVRRRSSSLPTTAVRWCSARRLSPRATPE